MIPRRDADGWCDLGPVSWKVHREDNHGDRSTTTTLKLTWAARGSVTLELNRPWRGE